MSLGMTDKDAQNDNANPLTPMDLITDHVFNLSFDTIE